MGLVAATAVAGLGARLGFPLPPSDRRIGQVDGLRGYLALAVMAHHFSIWTRVAREGVGWVAPRQAYVNELGNGGVALFFMTTGLVFYPRILKGFGAASWPAIYITRVFRILPMIVATTIVITGIVIARTGLLPDWHYLIAATRWVLTLGQPPLIGDIDAGRVDANVLWSLRYEWLFYLIVLPALAWLMDQTRGHWPSWAVCSTVLAAFLLARMLPGTMFQYAPLFLIGMLAYECERRPWIARLAAQPATAVIASAALIAAAAATPVPYGFALPAFALFFGCVACGNRFGGMLATQGARVLGECSYSIYLLHGIVLSLLFTEGAGAMRFVPTDRLPLLLPLAMVVASVLALASFLLIERPAIVIGARLAREWAGRRAPRRAAELEIAP